ncbi:MAG TPA: hypothetical protein VHP83_03915 [Aggregatilineaceae bacterium]|nr:hypothetical protein [Aggregatilineaceae bacterium]
MTSGKRGFFVRVTNVGIFNALVQAAEKLAAQKNQSFEAQRRGGYYEIVTHNAALWHEIYLYGQMLAQAQDENIDGGEFPLQANG